MSEQSRRSRIKFGCECADRGCWIPVALAPNCRPPKHRRQIGGPNDCRPRCYLHYCGQEVALRPFANVRRLFHGLGHALRQPEVQGVAQLALSLILITTIFYWFVEGWSLLDAAYFAVVTIATVGYGDFAPQTTLGKIFTIGYIVSG